MLSEDNPIVIYMVLVKCCLVGMFGCFGAGFHVESNCKVNHTNYLGYKL